MAYTTPKTWAFGDRIYAADLNKYSDNLSYWQGSLPDAPAQAGGPHGTILLVNTHRWLVYMPDSDSDARTMSLFRHEIEENTTSLESRGEDGKAKWLDLDTIEWLVRGMAYTVTDVLYAIEVEDAG